MRWVLMRKTVISSPEEAPNKKTKKTQKASTPPTSSTPSKANTQRTLPITITNKNVSSPDIACSIYARNLKFPTA